MLKLNFAHRMCFIKPGSDYRSVKISTHRKISKRLLCQKGPLHDLPHIIGNVILKKMHAATCSFFCNEPQQKQKVNQRLPVKMGEGRWSTCVVHSSVRTGLTLASRTRTVTVVWQHHQQLCDFQILNLKYQTCLILSALALVSPISQSHDQSPRLDFSSQ